MTDKKTRSLTLANDPVARLREMHQLDNPNPHSAPGDEASPRTDVRERRTMTNLAVRCFGPHVPQIGA